PVAVPAGEGLEAAVVGEAVAGDGRAPAGEGDLGHGVEDDGDHGEHAERKRRLAETGPPGGGRPRGRGPAGGGHGRNAVFGGDHRPTIGRHGSASCDAPAAGGGYVGRESSRAGARFSARLMSGLVGASGRRRAISSARRRVFSSSRETSQDRWAATPIRNTVEKRNTADGP